MKFKTKLKQRICNFFNRKDEYSHEKFIIQKAIKFGDNFKGFRLIGVKSTASNLVGINFNGVDLTDALFYNVDLSGAKFKGANLTDAVFVDVNLTNADLSCANMTNVNIISLVKSTKYI